MVAMTVSRKVKSDLRRILPAAALDFGPIDELRKKHGDLAAVAPLPRAHFTKPNIVIKPNANSRPTGDTTGYLANPKEV